MSLAMINTLVEHNIIRPGTEVEAKYIAGGLDGSNIKAIDFFEVLQINQTDNKVKSFVLSRKTDNMQIQSTPTSVLRIDGMDIRRVVESHELKIEEDILKTTKRKYMHKNADKTEVEYTEITYFYADGKTKRERFNENGEKIPPWKKKNTPS